MSDAYRRFEEVDALLEQALELPAVERRSFLTEAAAHDSDLLAAVERLLAAVESDSPLERGEVVAELGARAADLVRDSAGDDLRSLESGARFGAYEVLGPIGAGGMGEVYRALDSRLGREVALKVLPAELANDDERISRLEREARMLATLHHPNINGIFELEHHGTNKALVLELVEGDTLAELLGDGALPLEQALSIAIQIVTALEAAHDEGVVHRDLKPSNIKITPAGRVKVLDFGLAKPIGRDPKSSDSRAATFTDVTAAGAILGTAAYMSPEQWRGEAGDERSDLWALGCVLYEMLTGERAFDGGSGAETAAAVLEREPDWSALPSAAGSRLVSLLQSCLAKQPAERPSDAMSTRLALEQALVEAGKGTWQTSVHLGRGARWLVAALLLSTFVLVIWQLTDRADSNPATGRIDSIAVLPFENGSEAPEGAYLSDGVTDSLINSLARLPGLRVVPRGMAFSFRDRNDLQAIARELDVRALLTGRVSELDGTVLLNAELTDASTVAQVWGRQYRRPSSDLLAVQEELVERLVEELRIELTAEQKQRALDPATENPEAYRLFLRAKYHLLRGSPEGTDLGLEYAQQAVDLDPGYALAYAALSNAHMTRAFLGRGSWQEAGDLSRAATRQALQLDDSLAAGWIELGFVRHHFDWDWQGAEQAFARAVELEPNNAEALQGHSEALLSLGRIDEAVQDAAAAVRANPMSAQNHAWLGLALYHARDFEEGLRALDAAREIEPRHYFAYGSRLNILVAADRIDEAIETHQRFAEAVGIDLTRDLRLASLYARAGRQPEARQILLRIGRERAPTAQLAQTLGLLGERDRTFEILDQMVQRRDRGLLFINTNPAWDPLRDDRRFAELVKDMGLPQTSESNAKGATTSAHSAARE